MKISRKPNNPALHRKLQGDAERIKPYVRQMKTQDSSETGSKICLAEMTALPADSILIL